MSYLFKQCAWCHDFLEETNSEFNQAICSSCSEELGSIPTLKVENIPHEFLDDLPYGNIILRPDNTVLRYNATEARYTGYNPSKIEGRNFFTEIAPCTQVAEFHGLLEEFRENSVNGQYLFKFTFDKPKFQALISILMTHYADSGYTVISIRKIRDIDPQKLNATD